MLEGKGHKRILKDLQPEAGKKKSKLVEHIYLSFTSLIDKAALLLVNLHLMLMSLFSLYPQKIFF